MSNARAGVGREGSGGWKGKSHGKGGSARSFFLRYILSDSGIDSLPLPLELRIHIKTCIF